MNQCGRNPTAADLQKSTARRISLQIAEPGGRHEVRSNPGLQTVARGTGGTDQAITPGLIVLNRASWDSDLIRSPNLEVGTRFALIRVSRPSLEGPGAQIKRLPQD